jgi:hypothetical protein
MTIIYAWDKLISPLQTLNANILGSSDRIHAYLALFGRPSLGECRRKEIVWIRSLGPEIFAFKVWYEILECTYYNVHKIVHELGLLNGMFFWYGRRTCERFCVRNYIYICSKSCLSEFLSMGQIGSDGTDQIADFKKYFPFLFLY